MRYITYGNSYPSFPRLTLLSLLVNPSASESVVSNNVLGSGALLAQTARQTSLEHFLASTDPMEAFLVSASSTMIEIASSSESDQSPPNTQAPQNDESSWSIDQFMAHRERIDDICMGLHDRAASKAHQRALFAQMDAILTCF
jgi:hypothetical protein